MTVRELLTKAELMPVSKGKRMELVGWADGYLVVKYKGSKVLYVHGPNVAECERDKLLKVPYPDSLLQKLKGKHAWNSYKVE